MDAVNEIKRRIDIAEYVGRFVQLQKTGRNLKGLCPFHAEKTASFYVTPDRASWRCYGSCGEGGDIFSFVQKREGLDFRDALRELALEAGVELSAQSSVQRDRRDQLASIVSASVDYYREQLQSANGAEARAYFRERRGFSDETVATFHLGWAPDDWRALRDHLNARGYTDADCLAAGVLVEPDEGGLPYDRFRGRVVIPISDDKGVFVGLGGRGMNNEQPKYLNSPQTGLFDKGRTLFGLNGAAPDARASGTVVVVEGYMDVIGPWDAGFRNLVATMGTSLTQAHAGMLKRYASRIVLAMDADSAGLAAAERAGDLLIASSAPADAARSLSAGQSIAEQAEVDLYVVPMPSGKDPDDMAREEPDLWRASVASAQPFAAFVIDRALGVDRPESPLETRKAIERIAPVLNAVRDAVERASYVQRVARHLRTDENAVAQQLATLRRAAPFGPGRNRQPRQPNNLKDRRGWERYDSDLGSFLTDSARQRAERAWNDEPVRPDVEEQLLATVFQNPALRENIRILPPDLFVDAQNRAAFSRWRDVDQAAEGSGEDPVANRVATLRAMRQPSLSPEEARARARDLIDYILRQRLIHRHTAVTEELAAAESTHGTAKVEQVGRAAWLGSMPDDETIAVAQTVIEQLELGMSIHRRERTEIH
jgi:DNA primase